MSFFCTSGVTIYEEDVQWAAQQNIITPQQAALLWPQLQNRSDDRWKMGWVHFAYFLGGMLILGSMTWLTGQAWNDAKGLSLFFLSTSYVGVFWYAGYALWNGKGPAAIPQLVGGIFSIVSVFIVPVAVFSLQRYFDFWEQKTPGLLQLSATLVAGLVSIKFVHFTLLTFPICVALFGIAELDVPPLIFSSPTREDFDWVSVVFGVLMVVGSYVLDKYQQVRQTPQDYAFWSYLYGVVALFSGLTDLRYVTYNDCEAFKWIYLAVNLVMCAGTPLLNRNVFIVFGGLGASSAVVDFLVVEATLKENAWIAATFGTVLVVAGVVAQKKSPTNNFPFWAYLFGSTIFFGGISTLYGNIYRTQLFGFFFFLLCVGLCCLSLYTQYRIFFWYGLVGGNWYIGELVYVYYWNSWWLPFILTALGLAIIALAVWLSKQTFMKMRREKKQREQDSANAKFIEEQRMLLQEYEMQEQQIFGQPQGGMSPVIYYEQH